MSMIGKRVLTQPWQGLPAAGGGAGRHRPVSGETQARRLPSGGHGACLPGGGALDKNMPSVGHPSPPRGPQPVRSVAQVEADRAQRRHELMSFVTDLGHFAAHWRFLSHKRNEGQTAKCFLPELVQRLIQSPVMLRMPRPVGAGGEGICWDVSRVMCAVGDELARLGGADDPPPSFCPPFLLSRFACAGYLPSLEVPRSEAGSGIGAQQQQALKRLAACDTKSPQLPSVADEVWSTLAAAESPVFEPIYHELETWEMRIDQATGEHDRKSMNALLDRHLQCTIHLARELAASRTAALEMIESVFTSAPVQLHMQVHKRFDHAIENLQERGRQVREWLLPQSLDAFDLTFREAIGASDHRAGSHDASHSGYPQSVSLNRYRAESSPQQPGQSPEADSVSSPGPEPVSRTDSPQREETGSSSSSTPSSRSRTARSRPRRVAHTAPEPESKGRPITLEEIGAAKRMGEFVDLFARTGLKNAGSKGDHNQMRGKGRGKTIAGPVKPQAKVREDIARKLRKELTALCEGLYPSAK